MQKFSSLLLAFIVCAGTMFADGTKIGDLYYYLNADNLTAEVTYQEYWSETNYSYLTAVNIPESVEYNAVTYRVTSIGKYAFWNCSGLTSVTIGNSVTSIGKHAFERCFGLTSIEIPNSVISIGDLAFSGCTGLTSITIPNSVTSIGNEAFYNCYALTSITIPNSVTSIGKSAFHGCSGLTSVTIGNSVTSIENSAFSGCSGLTSITIPNSVTSIGNSAFYFVPNIVYSGSATGSPWGARSVNGYVDGFLVYSDNTKTNLLACSSQATGTIEIPNSVTSIGKYAFWNCSGLTSVTIGNSVTNIGEFAFWNCSGLTSVTIGNSVTSIGKYAFERCSGLTSIEIPNSVISIGDLAFNSCTGLTSITIPNSVTSIGNDAFYECYGLTSVTNYATTPQTIESNVFEGVNQSSCTLYVPEGSIDLYKAAEVWKDFSNIQAIDTEDIDQIQLNSTVKNHKILYNGKVYILTGDKTYTVTGQQLK